MTTVGVITRGKYGQRLIDTVLALSDMRVVTAQLPQHLPEFIDDPAGFISSLDLDPAVFKADFIITYSLHPDITPQIARMAGEAGVKALIVPNGKARVPMTELEQISEEYSIHIEVDDLCCKTRAHPSISDLNAIFGTPILSVTTSDSKIIDVKVLRGAPCGSTWSMAEKIIGTPTREAPARAGLLIQQYPCRAVRGGKGGIHESAQLHRQAMEAALKREAASRND